MIDTRCGVRSGRRRRAGCWMLDRTRQYLDVDVDDEETRRDMLRAWAMRFDGRRRGAGGWRERCACLIGLDRLLDSE